MLDADELPFVDEIYIAQASKVPFSGGNLAILDSCPTKNNTITFENHS
jgi:hypothetical protein